MRSGRLRVIVGVLAAWGVAATPALARQQSPPLRVVSVTALPPPVQRAGGVLQPGRQLNVIFTSNFIALRVVLRNAGSSALGHVVVKVVISRVLLGAPLTRTASAGAIGPGQTTTLTFSHLGKVPFAMPSSLKIEATGAQTSLYPVVFTSPD